MAPSTSSSTNAKQRRGKQQASNQQQKTATEQLVEQLDRAAVQLTQSRAQMLTLHQQWQMYLTILSYVVVALSIQQVYAGSRQCLSDIANANANAFSNGSNTNDTLIILQWEAIMIATRDSAVPILGVCMALLLSLFLRSLPSDSIFFSPNDGTAFFVFSHPLFLTAQSCILPLLMLYFHHQHQSILISDNELAHNTTSSGSCLAQSLSAAAVAAALSESTTPTHHTQQQQQQLPAVLVFDAISVISLWMMQRQQAHTRKSAKAIQDLQRELTLKTGNTIAAPSLPVAAEVEPPQVKNTNRVVKKTQ